MRRLLLFELILLIAAIPVGALFCQCPYTSPCPYDSGTGDNVGQHKEQGIWYCDYEHIYLDPDGKPTTHSFSQGCR